MTEDDDQALWDAAGDESARVLATAGVVLGVMALVALVLPHGLRGREYEQLQWLLILGSPVVAVCAIGCGLLARTRAPGRPQARAAIILGAVGLALGGAQIALLIYAVSQIV